MPIKLSMVLSLPEDQLMSYVLQQVQNYFPDGVSVSRADLKKSFDLTLERMEFCFSRINLKYFRKQNNIVFNHLHADHYAMFLYLFANSLYKNDGDKQTCAKLFQLNRCLHGLDAFYEVELPDIFLFVHPLGTVLGRATYANHFVVYQQCNIGSNKDQYPVFEEYVTMHPGASVLGPCHVGRNSRIAAGALLLDRNLEKDSIYIGNPKRFDILANKETSPMWV